jgi:hypothetical protein
LVALEKARKCWVSVPGFKFVVLNNLEDRRAAVSASARMRATTDFVRALRREVLAQVEPLE